MVGVNGLRLGNLVFDNIPSIRGIPNFYKCWGVEGVIGSNLLRGSIVFINPSDHIIVLTDQIDRIPVDPKKGIPLVTNIGPQSDPKIRIQFSKRSEAVMGFDTGDGSFMRISEEYMDELKKTNVFSVIKKGYGSNQFSLVGAEKNAEKYMLKFPTLNIAGTLFTNVIVATDKKTNPAMGSRLLDYGAVTLDFIHGRFYFNAGKPSNDLDEKQWPFQPTIEGDKLVIGLVWDKGPAEVRPGQQILAIDDKECEHVDLCDIITGKIVLIGKDSATLSIRDGQGIVRKININKE